MDRRAALDVLGLPEGVELADLKQRFRTLARDRHPDVGGDPAAFQDLHTAYEVLRAALADAPEPPAPRVARGRPSREDGAATAARALDADTLDTAAEELARRLVSAGTARVLSRGPGAWLNRFAASLAVGTTSTLEVVILRPRVPGAGHTGRLELTCRGRAARRALTAVDPGSVGGAPWSRRRGDAITVLEAEVTGEDRELVARRAVAAATRLLTSVGWPLTQWHPDTAVR
jgi:hypothetical protein